MRVQRFNVAERFVGTMDSHRTRQLSIYQSMRLRLHMVTQPVAPLPFIHSLSGRYTTSYPYFTGKKTWNKSSMKIDIPLLEELRRWRPRCRSDHCRSCKAGKNSSWSQFMSTRVTCSKDPILASTKCTHFLTTSHLC